MDVEVEERLDTPDKKEIDLLASASHTIADIPIAKDNENIITSEHFVLGSVLDGMTCLRSIAANNWDLDIAFRKKGVGVIG